MLLSPVFLAIALAIVIESPGPAIYTSSRIGQNWRRFTFYKFRSMRQNTDIDIDKLKRENNYIDFTDEDDQMRVPRNCDPVMLYSDNYRVNENDYLTEMAKEAEISFVKLENDPRITKVGKFLRKTSIDELPQLWNVLKGDMSLVGNRPLPEYEAELLTTDKYGERFNCSSGLTGLWQIQPDKDNISPDQRKALDVEYARNACFKYDVKLFFATVKKVLSLSNE